MNEKHLEQEEALQERLKEDRINKRVRYSGYFMTCQEDGCGVQLPTERRGIGLCIECAEDLARIEQARLREGK